MSCIYKITSEKRKLRFSNQITCQVMKRMVMEKHHSNNVRRTGFFPFIFNDYNWLPHTQHHNVFSQFFFQHFIPLHNNFISLNSFFLLEIFVYCQNLSGIIFKLLVFSHLKYWIELNFALSLSLSVSFICCRWFVRFWDRRLVNFPCNG